MIDIITGLRTNIFKITFIQHVMESLHKYKDKFELTNVIEDNGNIWIVLSYAGRKYNKYILKFNGLMKVKIYLDTWEYNPFSIFETKRNIYVTSGYFVYVGKKDGPVLFGTCENNMIYSQVLQFSDICKNHKFYFIHVSKNEFIKIDKDGNRKKYRINESILSMRCNNTLLVIRINDGYCILYDMRMRLLRFIKYNIYEMNDKYIIKGYKDTTFIKFNLKLNLNSLTNTEYKHILRLFMNV